MPTEFIYSKILFSLLIISYSRLGLLKMTFRAPGVMRSILGVKEWSLM